MRTPLLVLALAAAAFAQETLTVGVKEAPPFVMKDGERWTGISVELWERIAGELGYASEYREHDLESLLGAVENGEVDVAVAALTVTPEREERMDFTHSFFNSGLGIAVPAGGGGGGGVLGALVSWRFLRAFGALLLVLLAAGVLVWIFERRRNAEEFGGDAVRGIGSGFWWSAVTMTTVGYGDKAPRTLGGRVVGFAWMFVSVIIIATFTGAIASALTVERFTSAIRGPGDLPGKRVAVVRGSTSEEYLRRLGARVVPSEDVEGALRALDEGDAEAAVHDAPILRYLLRREFAGRFALAPEQFQRQDYAFAVPGEAGERLERVNRALLRALKDPFWRDVQERYFGR